MFGVKWWLWKVGCFCRVWGLQLLLAAHGCLTSFFSIKLFKGFFQKYPRYLERVPLGYEEFVFDVSGYATRDVAKPEVVGLSKSESMEYS